MTAAHIGSLPLESVAAYIAPPLVGWISLAAHLSPTVAYMWHVTCGTYRYITPLVGRVPLVAHLSPTATNCLPLAPSSPCPGATCPAHCAQGVLFFVNLYNLTYTYFWPRDRSMKNPF